MGKIRSKPVATEKNGANGRQIARQIPDVLTLAEVSEYLRVPNSEVIRLVEDDGLPGRRIRNDWRFLRSAVDRWLSAPAGMDAERFWNTHFGALAGDPYLDEIVHAAYRNREVGRDS